MADISAAQVKKLRDATGAGIMDCKKALTDADADMDLAIDNLRKSGILKAERKSGRATNEGKVAIASNDSHAAMVEVLCETDFVAKNQEFIDYTQGLAERVLADDSLNGDTEIDMDGDEKGKIGELVSKVGENIQVRRVRRVMIEGTCGLYLHAGGKIGVIADIKGDASAAAMQEICMGIAAYDPSWISPEDVPEDVVAKEKEIIAAQANISEKPEEIQGKIINGKLQKWYGECCLMRQRSIRDEKQTVEKANPGVTILSFDRWVTGEPLD